MASLKYHDVVYSTDIGLVWCEYRARMHTIVEIRYQVKAFNATEEYVPERVFRQEDGLEDSSWKKTPKEARDQLATRVGIELDRDKIVWEKAISISIPIVNEEF